MFVTSDGDGEWDRREGWAPAYDEEGLEDDDEDWMDDEEYSDSEEEVGKEGAAAEEEEDRGKPNVEEEEEREVEKGEVEEKKSEPFAVPTAGAFYMHDDRFRESRGGGGRHRRTFGGRKLWESRDERAWVHDRFEDMSLQNTQYNEGRRNFRGRFRGRGRGRVAGRGYGRGNRYRASENRSRPQDDQSQGYINGSHAYMDRVEDTTEIQNRKPAPKIVRGRGPRRYEPLPSNSHIRKEVPSTQKKSNARSYEQVPSSNAGRQSSQTSNVADQPIVPRKQAFASNLNSASPPFYPSGSSSQDTALPQNTNAQTGDIYRDVPSSILNNDYSSSHSNALLRVKDAVEFIDQRMLSGNSSHLHLREQPPNNIQMQSSGGQSAKFRNQGRGSSSGGQLSYPQSPFSNQGWRVQAPVQPSRSIQVPPQPVTRASTPQSGQQSNSGPSSSSNFQTQSVNTSEACDLEASTASKAIIAGKEKIGSQGSGGTPFVYNGTQFIGPSGTLGLTYGDKNFPGTPALLPVMQFSGQSHGGLGVPAVGMALPGYVAQPQLGYGNSEMTWLPMLTGAAAGALGASYGPYITLDSGYNATSGQTSSPTAPKESAMSSANTWKSSQRSDLENEEFGQRQNKPRRYSEMNFGQ